MLVKIEVDASGKNIPADTRSLVELEVDVNSGSARVDMLDVVIEAGIWFTVARSKVVVGAEKAVLVLSDVLVPDSELVEVGDVVRELVTVVLVVSKRKSRPVVLVEDATSAPWVVNAAVVVGESRLVV